MSRKKEQPTEHGESPHVPWSRKSNGQFGKGNRFGVGNAGPNKTAREKKRELEDALLSAVSAADIIEIGEELVKEAKKQSPSRLAAVKTLLDIVLPKDRTDSVEVHTGAALLAAAPPIDVAALPDDLRVAWIAICRHQAAVAKKTDDTDK